MRNGRRKLAAMAGIAAIGMMVGLVPPAGAGPTVLTGNANSLGHAGSDTTYWLMSGIAPQWNTNLTRNTGHDYVTEIPPLNQAPFPAGTYVPADAITTATLWDSSSAPVTPPDGSSAGIAALQADTTGAIDFARSSRGPNAGETTTLDFWAYALGALDYVTFTGTNAPAAGLTQQQLIDIYTCNASGVPIISNWSQVGGSPGTIKKYLPQTASGTYSFFRSKLLNGNTPDFQCNASNLSTFLQEHDARGVTTASKPNAIYAYDWARFNAQTNGVESDLRNGATLGKLGVLAANRIAPSTTTVNENTADPATHFLGTRYVFNVVRKANHPAGYTSQLLDVTRLIGVRASSEPISPGPGFICQDPSAPAATWITRAGFVKLNLGATGGTGLPQSRCRLNPNPL